MWVYVCVHAFASVYQWVFEAKEGGLHALVLLGAILPLLPLPIKKLLLYERSSGQVKRLETQAGLSWLSSAILS